jgi:signal transduction histidine kinase
VTVALVCILAGALTANLIAQSRVRNYFRQCQGGHMGAGAGGGPTSQGALNAINQGFLIATLAALVLGLAMSYFIARGLSRPLSQLTSAAESIEGGDYSRRVEVGGAAEIEELAHAFNSLAESLRTNEKLRRNMVADIAHELRNPLASIKAQLEAWQDGVMDHDGETVVSLAEDVDVLARLVEDLHQLSVVESGQMELERMPVDAAEAVAGIGAKFAHELEAGKIEFTAEIEDDLPPVDADPVRLSQVLGNLVKNAITHTPPGGKITAGARLEGSMVEFSVSDTGTGIAPEDLQFIFERFYRAERARERATGGAGIGLTVARSLVVAHGGSVRAESEPGRGTTIYFTIPVRS